jgi:tetratricopeptide (TPR) repeat protein
MRTQLLLVVLLTWFGAPPVSAEVKPLKEWRQMRSANFYLMGDVSEGDLRRVAGRLEQFRAAVGRLLPKASVTTATPTTVIVFRSHRNFQPFKPLYNGKVNENIAGYFMGGPAINYITMTTEMRGEGSEAARYGIIYHELVHLMVNNTVRGVPVWFNEGLAEYYRTLEVEGDGKQVLVGRIHSPHVLLLREQFIPVDQLVAVDHRSPLYNEGAKSSIFYAESWALVHYLLLGEKQKDTPKAAFLLDALVNGTPFPEACQRVLGISSAQLQKELRAYVERESFTFIKWTFPERFAAIEGLPAAPVTDAEAHATAGALLLRMGRLAEATEHLAFALKLAPDSVQANATLGMLLAQQNRADLALTHLQGAAAGVGATAQTHYDLAAALQRIREGGGDAGADADARIEGALRQAIALDPGFAEAYASLARVLAARPGSGNEPFMLQQKAIALSPGREDYMFNLGIYLANQQQYADARTVLTALAAGASDERVKSGAVALLKNITDFERKMAAGDVVVERNADGPRVIQFDFRRVKEGEAQLKGALLAIECPHGQLVLVVAHDGTTSRVHAKAFEGIEFITYRKQEAGTISCGKRPADDRVRVTYMPSPQGASLGEVVAVEFMPAPSVPQ